MEQETWHTHPGGVSKAHSDNAKQWLQISHISVDRIPNTMRSIRLIRFGQILVKSNFPLSCMHHLYKMFLYLIYAYVPACMYVHYTSAETFGGESVGPLGPGVTGGYEPP